MNQERQDAIDSILGGTPNRLREAYFSKHHPSVYRDISEYTLHMPDLKFKQRVWHWVNEAPDYARCGCGSRVSAHMNWVDGYKRYCSAKCSANSGETREKARLTLVGRYGVDHYSKTGEYSEKVRKTSLEKWGVDNYAKTDEYVARSKRTYLERYGVDSYTKTDEYVARSKRTYLERYGVDHYAKTDEYREKFRAACLEKWGVDHPFKGEFYRVANFEISKDPAYLGYLGGGISQFRCSVCGLDFEISTDDYYGRKRSGNDICTACNPISSQSSIKETALLDLVSSAYAGEVVANWRDKYEIDVYIPELSLGFEFNGLFWHSEKYKGKRYHIDKTLHFESLGIRVVHVWEDDWVYRREIVRSQVLNAIGMSTRKIYARSCMVCEIDAATAAEFLEMNHIQGQVKSVVKLGLYHRGELVSVMTFDRFEGRKRMPDGEWNLSRFCNRVGTNCVGGASKLLSFFLREWKPSRVISYADRDWSTGDLYGKLGFERVHLTPPDYKYVVGDRRVHKSNYRKSAVGETASESVYMKDVPKIWDCGKIKFEMKRPL